MKERVIKNQYVSKVLGGGVCLSLLFFASLAQTEVLTFTEVWEKIKDNSPAIEASSHRVEASVIANETAEKNLWIPTAYLEGRVYNTNDPGAVFMGKLEQRSVKQNDFDPDVLNQPGYQNYWQGKLGVDLPLYVGGQLVNQSNLSQHDVKLQKTMGKMTKLSQYTSVVQHYGKVLVTERQVQLLQQLEKEISVLIKQYKLGGKENPVGHSGILGLKSLRNRVIGLMQMYQALNETQFESLKALGVSQENWSPELINFEDFVNKYISFDKKTNVDLSFGSIAMEEQVRMAELAVEMEKANLRPKIGLFAETSKFSGDRQTDSSVTAGVYLQWGLFDLASRGRVREKTELALAKKKSADAFRLGESVDRVSLYRQLTTLRENARLIEENLGLNQEQIKTSTTLFRNGSINVLQFVELLNRRTDIIEKQTEIRLMWLQLAAVALNKEPFEIK